MILNRTIGLIHAEGRIRSYGRGETLSRGVVWHVKKGQERANAGL